MSASEARDETRLLPEINNNALGETTDLSNSNATGRRRGSSSSNKGSGQVSSFNASLLQGKQQANTESHAGVVIKNKLAHLSDRFLGFEQTLQLTRVKKKEDEDKRIVLLQKQLTDIQAALCLESTNRSSSMHALQSWVEDQMKQFTDRVQIPIQEKLAVLVDRIEEVNDRIDVVQAQHEAERDEFPAIIDARSNQLLEEIRDMRKVFEHEQKATEEKHKQVLYRINEQHAALKKIFVADKAIHEIKIKELRREIQDETQLRVKAEKVISKSIVEQTQELAVQIENEVREREEGDEALVQAVNHYTAALQDGLKLAVAT
jgi:hypothetical protein